MNFQSLLKQAAQNTAAQQAELAQKEKARQAAAREAELAAATKAAADKKAAEQRKREREERERKFKEEEARKKAALPATRNLYALKQERIKRGLNPDGSEDHLLVGGAKAGPSKAPLVKKPAASSSKATSKAPAKEKDTYVSREDKAARQRKAMFKDDDDEMSGSMLLAKLQKKSGDSPKPSGISSPRPFTSSNGLSSKPKPRPSTSTSRPPIASTSKGAPASAPVSAKDRLKAGFDPTKFIRLNTEKRDTRTIEEIEADMRKKKGVAAESSRPPGPKRPNAGPPPPSNNNKRKPDQDLVSPKRPKLDQRNSSKARRRQSSTEDSESESESEDSRDGRRGRRGMASGLDDSMRSEIWGLMGRDRSKDVLRDLDSDDDEMEASGADVWREEQRAARLAAKEDSEEQERLRIAAEKKRARLNKG